MNIDDKLERDIKILINHIILQKELQDAITISKTSQFFKRYSNFYLTNITLWYKYKCYIFYNILITIFNDEAKKLKPFNNKSLSGNINLINKIYNSFKDYISEYPDRLNENEINHIKSNLENQEKFNIITNSIKYDEKIVIYPTNFEIIDEFIFNELKKRFDNFSEDNYLKCEVIVNEEKIIINYDKSNNNRNISTTLLIGESNNDLLFNLKYLINFSEENNRKEVFEDFLKNKYEAIIKKYESYFIRDDSLLSPYYIQFIDSNMNFDENHLDNKIIKIFLFLFLFEEEIEQIKKNSIKINGNCFYYLINKEWMDIYKNFYEYQKLYIHFENMKKNKLFDYNYKQLIECNKNKNNKKVNEFIYQLIKDIPSVILEELEKKKEQQTNLISQLNNNPIFIDKIYYKIKLQNKNMFKRLPIYGENALINDEIFDLFNQFETDEIKKSIKNNIEKIECLIGENKLYIKSEIKPNEFENIYYFLNSGYIEKNIFSPSILIYFYEKNNYDEMIAFLNKNSFSEYVHNFNLIDNSSCYIQNPKMENIGKIHRINDLSEEIKDIIINDKTIKPDGMKLLKLILYFIKFNKELQYPIKNIKKELGYFVDINFINEIKKLKIYKIIDEYITKNINIQEIINNNIDKNIDELSELVQKQFDIKINKEINSEEENINIYTTSYKKDLNYISINTSNYVYFANNFILLSKEIYLLFQGWAIFDNYSYNYFLGSNKVFIINEKDGCILIYNIKEKTILNLEFVLYFKSSLNSDFKFIKFNDFNNINEYILFGENNDSAPMFSSNENQIGYAFRYNKLINDYVYKDIYLQLKKIFVLYLHYQKLKERKSNKKFNEYYILNKNWIQNYKLYFDFDSLSKEIDKNIFNKDIIESFLKKNDEKFISDKKIFILFKSLSQKKKSLLIEKEKNFYKDYENLETKIPKILPLNYLDENHQTNSCFYYENFEIINSKIYNYLFKNINTDIYTEKKFFILKTGGIKNEGEKVFCSFDKKRIIIKLINNDIINENIKKDNSDKKCSLYIGQLNSSFIFELECIIIYNSETLMNEHIKIIEDSIGFNDFCEQFLNCKTNIKILNVGSKKCGLAIKKNQNKNWDNNDLISKYFTFAPKIGIDKIKHSYYMNALLQCFCQIEEFVSLFKYNNFINELINNFSKTEKNFLAPSFLILINKLWPDNESSKEFSQGRFYPSEFIQKIEDMSPLFKKEQSNNVKDFINFIIMTLHEELNQKIDYARISINKTFNYEFCFNMYYQRFTKSFNSEISDLFIAIQQTKTHCLNCGIDQYNFQAYFYLDFPLEEVKKYFINKLENENFINENEDKKEKLENHVNNININKDNNNKINIKKEKINKLYNNILNLTDCFDYFQKTDLLKENDQIFCNNCNKKVNAEYTLSLTSSPKLLILILDRGENFHSKIKLEFDLILDINKYIIQKNKSTKYKLISVVTYLKEKDKDEHCIANCLSPIDNQWYIYNDAQVIKVNDFQKEVIDFGLPHVLFYERIE